MALVTYDTEHKIIKPYICPECVGRTKIRWREIGDNKREQYVMVDHLPNCQTGYNAYNQVHNRKGNYND